jgi:hypothetical protein
MLITLMPMLDLILWALVGNCRAILIVFLPLIQAKADDEGLKIGEDLPSITLKNEKEEDVNVGDLAKEKGVVLFLVPKADTRAFICFYFIDVSFCCPSITLILLQCPFLVHFFPYRPLDSLVFWLIFLTIIDILAAPIFLPAHLLLPPRPPQVSSTTYGRRSCSTLTSP